MRLVKKTAHYAFIASVLFLILAYGADFSSRQSFVLAALLAILLRGRRNVPKESGCRFGPHCVWVQASNLTAALEMGGKAPVGIAEYPACVEEFEDVGRIVLDDIRSRAKELNIRPKDIKGRQGYLLFEQLTGRNRKLHDEAFKDALEPILNDAVPVRARAIADNFKVKLIDEVTGIDQLSGMNSLALLDRVFDRISNAKTVRELDEIRQLGNEGGYFPEWGDVRLNALLGQVIFAEAGNAARDGLYDLLAHRRRTSLSAMRAFQRRHEAAIQADQMAQQTATAISGAQSHASAEGPGLKLFIEAAIESIVLKVFPLGGGPKCLLTGAVSVVQGIRLARFAVDVFRARLQRAISGELLEKPVRVPGLAPTKVIPGGAGADRCS